MAFSLPLSLLACSTSIKRSKVLAKSGCFKISPSSRILPSRENNSKVDVHSSEFRSTVSASRFKTLDAVFDIGKPSLVSSKAGCSICSSDIVPYSARAVSQASGAEGTIVLSIPLGMSPFRRLLKSSREVFLGQRPSPLIVLVSFLSAM